jgi:flagellar basal-body rod protein FlgF
MDNALYTSLTRQSGLNKQMTVIANNIANAATTGFRAEGVTFTEFVHAVPGGESVSMAKANVQTTSMVQGAMTKTNGTFDFAIEGDGFFMVETPDGERLTRAGNFTPNAAGDLVNLDGHMVLDAGGAPIFIPPDAASIDVGSDGSISADGVLVGQVGVFEPVDRNMLNRETGVLFESPEGSEIVANPSVLQGFVENSNVNPIDQITRMIQVQRAYEMGQSFMETEDNRIREAMKTLSGQ